MRMANAIGRCLGSALCKYLKSTKRFNRRYRIMARYAYGKILDTGYAKQPNPYLPHGVTGIDVDPPKKGQDYSNYVKFVRDDATVLSKHFRRGEFDTVVSGNLLEHLENPALFIRECGKVLKRGGRLILTTDNPYRFQTVISNVLFPGGMISSEENHKYYVAPRNLNRIAKREGFRLLRVRPTESPNIPLLRQVWLFVYEKAG